MIQCPHTYTVKETFWDFPKRGLNFVDFCPDCGQYIASPDITTDQLNFLNQVVAPERGNKPLERSVPIPLTKPSKEPTI